MKRYRLRVWLACPSRAEDSRRCSSRNVTEGSRTPTVVPEDWTRSVAVAFRGRDLQVAALWFNNGIVLNTCLPFPLSKPLYQRQTAPSLSLSVSKHTVFFQRLNCMDQATHRDLLLRSRRWSMFSLRGSCNYLIISCAITPISLIGLWMCNFRFYVKRKRCEFLFIHEILHKK